MGIYILHKVIDKLQGYPMNGLVGEGEEWGYHQIEYRRPNISNKRQSKVAQGKNMKISEVLRAILDWRMKNGAAGEGSQYSMGFQYAYGVSIGAFPIEFLDQLADEVI